VKIQWNRSVSLSALMLLTACSTLPPHAPSPPPVSVTPKVGIEQPTATYTSNPIAVAQDHDLWGQLRGSFAMADCDADASVLNWAHRFTRNGSQFEDRMQNILPRLAYVQQVATKYQVAGEFVLLPWVESGFQTVPGRKNRPAGIWQIMPVTAGSMGLPVNKRYDARLDISASANAVMKLLKAYHDQFHDWRIADYAYNAGEFKIRRMAQSRGLPAATPVIPAWPVERVTREHLVKLLAIACVVRDPARFHVTLPTLSQDQQLVQVDLPHSMPVAQAAHHAGMSIDTMKDLNAAFRSDTMDADASPYLMLPASHVDQFKAAMSGKPSDLQAAAESSPSLIADATKPGDAAGKNTPAKSSMKHAARKTHKVQRGESLWQIAHRYSVDVDQLQRWNHLRGGKLKPGQILLLSEAD
jgi:membrane-bound lytic murein transglycosylase D